MNPTDPILVLGAGESGVGSALLAKSLGARAFVSDAGAGHGAVELERAGIDHETGGHQVDAWPEVAAVVKSPGIPNNAPVMKTCRDRGWEVLSEIEYASRAHRALGHQEPVVAVTGANGKTTTTALIAALFEEAGCNVACVGNIGKSWARDLSERTQPAAVQVVEVSSFQLDGVNSFRPDVAVLLNITPDHLDRYNNDIEQYADSKWRIASHQNGSDLLVLNADDPLSMARWKRDQAAGTLAARVVAVSTGQTESQLQNNLAAHGLHPGMEAVCG